MMSEVASSRSRPTKVRSVPASAGRGQRRRDTWPTTARGCGNISGRCHGLDTTWLPRAWRSRTPASGAGTTPPSSAGSAQACRSRWRCGSRTSLSRSTSSRAAAGKMRAENVRFPSEQLAVPIPAGPGIGPVMEAERQGLPAEVGGVLLGAASKWAQKSEESAYDYSDGNYPENQGQPGASVIVPRKDPRRGNMAGHQGQPGAPTVGDLPMQGDGDSDPARVPGSTAQCSPSNTN